MKKVALSTWFNYNNYGSILQVTALYKVISNLGYDVDIINYIPHGKQYLPNESNLETLKIMFNEKFGKTQDYKNNNRVIDSKRKEELFDNFRNKYLTFTDESNTISELNLLENKYDAFVCGSDQIWSPILFDEKYYFSYIDNKSKIMSYAPSTGVNYLPNKYIKEKMRSLINDFQYISVREEKGKKFIKKEFNKDVEVVLDPTLLLDKETWMTMKSNLNKDDEKYILVYFLGDNTEYLRYVKTLSKKLNLKVKILPIYEDNQKNDFEYIYDAGPGEFLHLIDNAEIICTDSFHGIVFSIIYGKKFIPFKRFKDDEKISQNERIYNLLDKIDYKESFTELELEKDLKCLNSVNYSLLYCKLDNLKQKSMNYLTKSLKECCKSKDIFNYSITKTCSGCAACLNVCKFDAIKITRNDNGFIKSQIDKNKCKQCGKCKKVCPFYIKKGNQIDKDINKLYSAYSKSKEVLMESSSGGFAYELSKYTLENGFKVIGCTYNKYKKKAEHIIIENKSQLHLLSGSKYLQSDTSSIINQILDIDKGIFFGTPCQVAGVDSILRMNDKRDNFILIDLICHGVPSYNLWDKYLKKIIKENNLGNQPDVQFRYKKNGWKNKTLKIESDGKIYLGMDNEDLFYRHFQNRDCFLGSCYECLYRVQTCADIRIGDYWGPKYSSNTEGVSMIIANSNIGKDLIENCLSKIMIIEEKECSDYWYQYPYNPIRPLYYEQLLYELRKTNKSIEQIFDIFDDNKNYVQKIYEVYKLNKNKLTEMFKGDKNE